MAGIPDPGTSRKGEEYTGGLGGRQRGREPGAACANGAWSLRDLLGPRGPLSRRLGDLEHRESQVQMAEAVLQTCREGGRLLVEAGPGTGKTFAYLVPALLEARPPQLRIVISTWTRNLQEQILHKDLPLLRAALDSSLPVALVLGRENYVCRRRAEEALARAAAEGSTFRAELRAICDWAARSRSGIQSEIPVQPSPAAWALARAERGNCLQQHSPFFQSCAWQWSRRLAKEAGILVVNHALLMADLKLRRSGNALLPSYQVLIVDEAHHLEEVAADHLGLEVRRRALLAVLAAVEREDATGITAALARRARDAVAALFAGLDALVGEQHSRRLSGGEFLDREYQPCLGALAERLRRQAESSGESQGLEQNARADEIQLLCQDLSRILTASAVGSVFWVERSEDGRDLALRSAPIETGPLLEHELFDPLQSVVLTSATLRAPSVRPGPEQDPFSYVRTATGLEDARSLALASPFDYFRQARICVDGLPEPGDPGYEEALIQRIPFHVRRSQGRALVLFTSRRTLQQVAQGIEVPLAEAGIRLLVQGRGRSRSDLLHQFRSGSPAALLGLASFWEGVDVPGPALSQVILTRLPFAAPGHPRDEARSDALRGQGIDPFRALALPQAVLRFLQGFGRLIRTREDHGLVTILDSRVLTKWYGNAFLAALPSCPWFQMVEDEEVPLDLDPA